MKLRLIAAALLVAGIAAFGSSNAASAKSCTPLDNESGEHEQTACTSAVTVDAVVPFEGSFSVNPLPVDTTLPNPPRVDFMGDAVTVSVNNSSGTAQKYAQVEICFSDPSQSGDVFRWVPASDSETLTTPNPAGEWFYVPTYHSQGMDCAQTWFTGTYTRN
jgi:hypothetical protein